MKRIDPATGKVYDDEEGIPLPPVAAPPAAAAPPPLALPQLALAANQRRAQFGVSPQGLALDPSGAPMRANVPLGGATEAIPPGGAPGGASGAIPPPQPIGLPQPGGLVKSGKTSGGSTSSTVISKEERRIRADQAKEADAGVDLAKQQGELDMHRAELEQQQAAAKAAHSAEWEAKRADVEAQANAHIQQRQEEYQSEVQRLREEQPHNFWANKSTGEKIAGAISIALGAYGGALSGHGGNVGLSIINSAIEQDARVQQEKMAKQRDLVGMAKEGVGEARLEKSDMLRDLQARKEAAWERVGDQFAAQAKALGPSQAGIAAAKQEQAARERASQIRLEAAELDRKKVESQWATQFAQTDGGAARAAKDRAQENAVFDPTSGNPVGQAPNATVAAKINAANKSNVESLKIIQEMRDLQKTATAADRLNPWSDYSQSMKSLGTGLFLAVKDGTAGMNSEMDAKRLEGRFGPDMARVFGDTTMMEKLEKNIHQQIAANLGSAGVDPGQSSSIIRGARNLTEPGPATQAPAAPARAKMSDTEIAGAQKWLRDNPRDPRAAAIRQRLTGMLSGGL